MTGESLAQAVAADWERIAAAVGSALAEFEAELTRLLRQLDGHLRDQSTIDAIFVLFDKHPGARAILQESLTRTGANVAKGAAVPGVTPQRTRYTTIPVFFGTSRDRTGSSKPTDYFGPSRADNSFGIVNVSIPDDHRMGSLEKPRWFKLQFRADPDKYVVVLSLEQLDHAQFVARGRSEMALLGKKEVLLFIHGFNVTFEDAARRAAQVSYDLNFEGLPALYSWPSEGSISKYLVDANNATWAEPHFREFLRIVREELGADAVHVIAHSMGTRLLANTLVSLAPRGAATPGRMQQVVFAAPDIDADTFRNLSGAFKGKAERITLYASSGDLALTASQQFQKYARAGQSGLDLVVVPTVDTVDASSVKTELLGHSLFGDADSLLSDLFYLIREGTPPAARSRLKKQSRYGALYWEFKR